MTYVDDVKKIVKQLKLPSGTCVDWLGEYVCCIRLPKGWEWNG